MTIVYCDYTSGNDSTGDGTSGNPYKTITQASTGLTGGDEVRCAKSPDPTALSGTLAWVDGSTSITTSVDLTGSLSTGDFVGKGVDDWDWWEIASITSTTITLEATYSGTTETVASYKLGITNTGTPSTSTTQVQTVSESGVSDSSRLKISGGWDLTGPTQDGFTWFVSADTSNRYGYGLYVNKNYLDYDRVGFARYNYGLYCYGGSYSAGDVYSIGCYNEGLRLDGNHWDFGTLTSLAQRNASYRGIQVNSDVLCCEKIIALSNTGDGFYSSSYVLDADEIIANRNGDDAVLLSPSNNNSGRIRLGNVTAKNNVDSALIVGEYGRVTIGTLTANNNAKALSFLRMQAEMVTIHNLVTSGNTTDINFPTIEHSDPVINIQRYNGENNSRIYFGRGHIAYKDSVEARGATGYCLRLDPADASYFMEQEIGATQVTSTASDITLSAYIKDDASFNGTVEAAIYHLGQRITGWTEWTPTTSYVKNSLIASSADLTNNEFLDLVLRVTGTAGNVYVDDFEVA